MCYCPVGECRADYPARYPYCAMSPKPPEIRGKVADGDSDYALADAIENLQKVMVKLVTKNGNEAHNDNGSSDGGRYKH